MDDGVDDSMDAAHDAMVATPKTKSSRAPRWLGAAIAIVILALLLMSSLSRLAVNVWLGAIATGLCLGFVALGVYISFRVLDCPDLTIDGSFPLGAAIAASLLVGGISAPLTLPFAFIGGALAGTATALIATRLRIHSLLASIITATALLSINLRIMGRSNVPLLDEELIFTPLVVPFRGLMLDMGGDPLARLAKNLLTILLVGTLVLVVKVLFDRLMHTEVGFALRATGDNPRMVRSLGTDTDKMIVLGLAISNGLVGVSGAIFAQYQGFADASMGFGLLIAGLAAVILGETLFRPKRLAAATSAVIAGMVIYRLAIAAALSAAIPLPGGESLRIAAQDVKLATAVLVLAALWFTRGQKHRRPS